MHVTKSQLPSPGELGLEQKLYRCVRRLFFSYSPPLWVTEKVTIYVWAAQAYRSSPPGSVSHSITSGHQCVNNLRYHKLTIQSSYSESILLIHVARMQLNLYCFPYKKLLTQAKHTVVTMLRLLIPEQYIPQIYVTQFTQCHYPYGLYWPVSVTHKIFLQGVVMIYKKPYLLL
jgi:hypothetical protein